MASKALQTFLIPTVPDCAGLGNTSTQWDTPTVDYDPKIS